VRCAVLLRWQGRQQRPPARQDYGWLLLQHLLLQHLLLQQPVGWSTARKTAAALAVGIVP